MSHVCEIMNTPTVKAIDRRSVHQICSGQVVVTLSTAMKELVENSLDAGATSIEIRLKNWGVECIEVLDNGSGVLPENFQALALKHHTSKLNVFSDLVGVETFGFRGEALSSLCALSNLCITTCHHSNSIGARIEYDHDGKITKQTAAARVPGTTVTLRNLFSTLPVRHKEFIRNIKREYAKLIQVLQSYCVISTGVRFNCYTQSDKGKKNLVLSTNGNAEMKENISNIFGPKQLKTLLEFKQVSPQQEDCEEQGLEITKIEESLIFHMTGFVSSCDHGAGRSTTDRQYVFINKRPCDLPKVIRIVNEVYHGFNRNQYPFLTLNFALNKELVDVNVTPDKRQVFLQQEKLLFATIKSSLKSMFDPGSSTYELNEKPLTQIKLRFGKPKDEVEKSEFSKSIKDRLLLANSSKVTKEKKYSSIMRFAMKLKMVPDVVEIKTPSVVDDMELKVQGNGNCFAKGNDGENAKVGYVVNTTIAENVEVEESLGKLVQSGGCGLDEEQGAVFEVRESEEVGNNFIRNDTDELEVESSDACSVNVGNTNREKAVELKVGSSEISVNDVGNDSRANVDELKRKFDSSIGDQRLGGSIHGSHKKIRLEDERELKETTTNRKRITVKYDWGKLGKKLACNRGVNSETSKRARAFQATITPENNHNAEEELRRQVTKDMFNEMDIIGQFNQGFIISKLKNDLFIIDQHASDEKYNFEDQQKNTVIKSQRLICPRDLDLTAVNEGILIENVEVFKKNGFDFEIDEEAPVSRKVKLTSLPVSKNWSFGKPDIDELIFMLSDNRGVTYRPSNVRKMFAMRACRMSIMVGTALNKTQMRRIVGHMGEMDHPWNCPHGRPTMRHLINLNMIRK